MREPTLETLVGRLRGARIVVLGDLVADEFVYGETERISREAPVLIVRHESSEVKPGCAANAIANLCALGAKVWPIGLVGDDETGRRLRALLEQAGAEVPHVATADGRPTATKTRVLAGGKNTRRQQMLRIDRDGPGDPGALTPRLLESLRTAMRNADALMVSDYGGGLLSRPLVEAARAFAAERRLVCVDARYDLAQYRGVTVAKPNEVELEQAVGHPIGDDPHLLESAGRELLSTLGFGSLLVTRGRSGMALLRPDQPTALVPVHGLHDAVDVTGAGDTVMAVHTLARAAGADPVDAMRLANVGGALVVQKPGTATVSSDELIEELRRSPPAAATLLEPGEPAVGARR